MFVRFEDLIYKYEQTTEMIRKWLGLEKESHVYVRERFNPDVSIRNTRLWEKFPEAEEDVRYIEKKLAEYLYPYEEI